MSTVQFNLLPLSKSKSLESRATQDALTQKITAISLALTAVFVLLLIYSTFGQKFQLDSSRKNIATKESQLEKVSNINTIITVENQLQTAADLHAQQNDTSRIFKYLVKLTPTKASVSNVNLDFTNDAMSVGGTADSASTVNAFIDSLKYAQYKVGSGSSSPAFSSVVESSFTINENSVSYTLSANFDPTIFANNLADADGHLLAPTLIVPSSTTAHNSPSNLFSGGSQ